MERYLGVREGDEIVVAGRRGELRRARPPGLAALLGAIVLGLVAIAVLGPRDPIGRRPGQDAPAAAHLQRMEETLAKWDLRGARRE